MAQVDLRSVGLHMQVHAQHSNVEYATHYVHARLHAHATSVAKSYGILRYFHGSVTSGRAVHAALLHAVTYAYCPRSWVALSCLGNNNILCSCPSVGGASV